ncbi:MAG TPA: ribose-5-phosphate isomerase RpiA [Herpetosiphonaceae bacterium]|nr:ribose-5-phosphate isomerase RpiA [Herpetosiphonaceae bacterium]
MGQDQDEQKREAATATAALVQPGMRLGLGSGSTVRLVVEMLAARASRNEVHDLVIVAASSTTEAALRRASLPVYSLDDHPRLDLAIDGADEVDASLAMIKGGGGALLRERIVLAAARERVIAVDASKIVPILGSQWPVPVEVARFGWRVAEDALRQLGAQPVLRMERALPVVTDEGNYLLDCAFGPIHDPRQLAASIAGLPGVMAHGIFLDLVDRLLIAGRDGVEVRTS